MIESELESSSYSDKEYSDAGAEVTKDTKKVLVADDSKSRTTNAGRN
jgi:NAD/NADP transhydrogenase alpha subunit